MGGREAGPAYDPELTERALRMLRRGGEPVGVRRGIAASWRRSFAHGVAHDALTPPYDDRAPDAGSPLVRAGDPVLEQLRADLAGSPACVTLADHDGRIVRRVSGDPRMDEQLDEAGAAPGFSYAEQHVGTNALGTALHDQELVVVHEREHYSDRLAGLRGSAAPVRDPVSGRVIGALGIAAPARPGDAWSWTALVRQSRLLVEDRLYDLQADGQRELHGAYLAALRQGRGQVFAVGPDLMRSPPEVRQLLAVLDHDQLWARVVDALASREEASVLLPLPTGRTVAVRLRAYAHRGRLVGALGELRPLDEAPQPTAPVRPVPPVREYVGWSVPVRTAAVALRRLADDRQPVCLAGEPGTGKATMVKLVARRALPGRPLVPVDATATRVCPERVAAHLAAGSPVLVRHAETVERGTVEELLDRAADRRGWLALSWRGDPEPLGERTGGPPLRVLTLPPLRSRPQDVAQAVERMLRTRPEARGVRFTPELLELLRRQPWPANLTGLAEVVGDLLAARRGGIVDAGALDEVHRATVRRRLTPVEWMLRTAIMDALRTHGGNKELAAASLGMSRASIYRKIKSLDIDVPSLVRG